jgi:2-hydroxyglutarate dehydrogenase
MEIQEIEPNVSAVAALHSPQTGIVDFSEVCRAIADELVDAGQEIRLGTQVMGISQDSDGCKVKTNRGTVTAQRVLICAGAWSDRLAAAAGGGTEPRIVPFRGAYLKIGGPSLDLVNGLVYPVPDPQLPFLGVHITRHIDRSLTIGPTALMVGSLRARRAYSINLRDAFRTVAWPGTWRLAWKYRNVARDELRHAFSKKAMIREAQQFVPNLREEDVSIGFSGVRAQAVARSGQLVDDFVFSEIGRTLHVRNAPSPAATSSFAIAVNLADRLEQL